MPLSIPKNGQKTKPQVRLDWADLLPVPRQDPIYRPKRLLKEIIQVAGNVGVSITQDLSSPFEEKQEGKYIDHFEIGCYLHWEEKRILLAKDFERNLVENRFPEAEDSHGDLVGAYTALILLNHEVAHCVATDRKPYYSDEMAMLGFEFLLAAQSRFPINTYKKFDESYTGSKVNNFGGDSYHIFYEQYNPSPYPGSSSDPYDMEIRNMTRNEFADFVKNRWAYTVAEGRFKDGKLIPAR